MLYKCAKLFILTKLWLSFFFYSSILVRHTFLPCMKSEQHFLMHEKKLDYHDMPSLFWCKTYFVCIYVSKFACIVIFDVINKSFCWKVVAAASINMKPKDDHQRNLLQLLLRRWLDVRAFNVLNVVNRERLCEL